MDDSERISGLVRAYIDHSEMRMIFNRTAAGDKYGEEMLCARVAEQLGQMEEKEQEVVLTALVERVREETERRHVMEKTVDSILIYAFNNKKITASQLLHRLVLTCDFSLRTALDTKKLHFVREKLSLIDYKGVRRIFKILIEKQMNMVPNEISPEQRRMLLPAEELLILILDRNSNVLPALFAISEISTLTNRRSNFIFPRVMAMATEMENSFRPLAELAYVTGRSYLFPIPSHPAFLTTAVCWRIDSARAVMTHRLHLPYKVDLYLPQFYVILMLLKQPRGKESLSLLLRSTTHPPQKAPLDTVLVVQLMEAMVKMERSAGSANEVSLPCPRYVWDNILHTLSYTITHGWCAVNRLLSLIAASVERTPYRKARDELMWCILQIVAIHGKEISSEGVQSIASIYQALYDKEERQTGASDRPSGLVRLLAAACLWQLLGESAGLPEPSPTLAQQISFIKDNADKADDDAILAVCANAYSPSSEEQKRVCRVLLSRVQSESTLPMGAGGRLARHALLPLSDELLDSLGVSAQVHLLQLCINDMRETRDILPSPAHIETMAKLACVLETEHGMKQLTSLFARLVQTLTTHLAPHSTATPSDVASCRDQLHVLIELLSYRLLSIPHPFKHNVIAASCTLLQTLSSSLSMQSNSQMITSIEQLCIRLWSWIPPSESVQLILRSVKNQATPVFLSPARLSPFSFELCRSLFAPYLKFSKITGVEVSSDLAGRLRRIYYWPESQLPSLSPALSAHSPDAPYDESISYTEAQEQTHAGYIMLRGLADSSWSDYFHGPEKSSKATAMLSAYFRFLYENLSEDKSQTVCQMVDKLKCVEVSECANILIDFIIQTASTDQRGDIDKFYSSAASVLGKMVLESCVISIDRLFMAIAFKPRSDTATVISLGLVRAIVQLPRFKEQLNAFCSLPKIYSPDYVKKCLEFNQKYPERMSSSFIPLPIYYGSTMLRLLPSVDVLIERALQVNLPDQHLNDILQAFSPLYKFHPFPLTFAYSILHAQHEQLGHSPRARQFLLAVCQAEASSLTQSFFSFNHGNLTNLQLARDLLHRLIAAFDISASPPPFVSSDWRSSELPPAGHALYAICSELLASPHSPVDVGKAFVTLLHHRKVDRPYVYLNGISLILTALPFSFNKFLFDEIIAFYGSEELNALTLEEAVFDNYEELALGARATRLSAVLALAQACWHHAATPTLTSFVAKLEAIVPEKVTTEKELFFTLHIIIPMLQRIAESKDKQLIERCVRVVVEIYKLVLRLCSVAPLEKEDTICDLLYHFKYMFVGDFARQEIEELVTQMPTSLREKLKFIVAQANKDASDPH